jgi:short-subunit dehydrogenase
VTSSAPLPPVALITGASSGIGFALAEEYAARGFRLVLVARREDKLKELASRLTQAGAEVLVAAADVTKESDLDRAVAKAADRFGGLDVVIANAGIGVAGPMETIGIAAFRRVMETNFFGVLRTAYAALPSLRASSGRFGIVGSVSGYLSMPGTSAYSASKYAARSLAESLHLEWAPLGISVTHIAPGFVESEIRHRDNGGKLREGSDDPVPAFLVMKAAKAARQIADALEAREAEIVLTGHGKAGAFLARHSPWLVRNSVKIAGKRAMWKR